MLAHPKQSTVCTLPKEVFLKQKDNCPGTKNRLSLLTGVMIQPAPTSRPSSEWIPARRRSSRRPSASILALPASRISRNATFCGTALRPEFEMKYRCRVVASNGSRVTFDNDAANWVGSDEVGVVDPQYTINGMSLQAGNWIVINTFTGYGFRVPIVAASCVLADGSNYSSFSSGDRAYPKCIDLAFRNPLFSRVGSFLLLRASRSHRHAGSGARADQHHRTLPHAWTQSLVS